MTINFPGLLTSHFIFQVLLILRAYAIYDRSKLLLIAFLVIGACVVGIGSVRIMSTCLYCLLISNAVVHSHLRECRSKIYQPVRLLGPRLYISSEQGRVSSSQIKTFPTLIALLYEFSFSAAFVSIAFFVSMNVVLMIYTMFPLRIGSGMVFAVLIRPVGCYRDGV